MLTDPRYIQASTGWDGEIIPEAARLPLLDCMYPVSIAGSFYGCGHCEPCVAKAMTLWANRLVLESECHTHSSFVTLTYNPAFRPLECNYDHIQKFMKRLRDALSDRRVIAETVLGKGYVSVPAPAIRYFLTGDYAQRKWTPHYHMALFGLDNRMYIEWTKGENDWLTVKEFLQRVWHYGLVDVQDLSGGSARYIVGYVSKKMLMHRLPEYRGLAPMKARMSSGTALGHDFILDAHVTCEKQFPLISKRYRETGELPPAARKRIRKIFFGRTLMEVSRGMAGVPDIVDELRKSNLRSYQAASNFSTLIEKFPKLDVLNCKDMALTMCKYIADESARKWPLRVSSAKARGKHL